MEKFIPFEKLSKKEQRKRNAQRRGSWQGISPVTRRAENPKAYNRRMAQKWKIDSDSVPFCFISDNTAAGLWSVCRTRWLGWGRG